MPLTPAEKQARYRDKYRRKVVDLEVLMAEFAKASIIIERRNGQPYIELAAPQAVRDALARYCQRQGIDVETYLEDVGRETLLAASRK